MNRHCFWLHCRLIATALLMSCATNASMLVVYGYCLALEKKTNTQMQFVPSMDACLHWLSTGFIKLVSLAQLVASLTADSEPTEICTAVPVPPTGPITWRHLTATVARTSKLTSLVGPSSIILCLRTFRVVCCPIQAPFSSIDSI